MRLILSLYIDQLNTTVHGTIYPYELVFGQPPRQNIFPGTKSGREILEENIQDLLSDDEVGIKKSVSKDENSVAASEKSVSKDEQR